MKKILFATVVLSSMLFASCYKSRLKGEGNIISETRTLSSFTEVVADGDVDVVIHPSTENKVVLTAYQNLIPAFKTDVNGSKLKLKYKNEYINIRNNNMKIDLYVTNINDASLNGSGKIVLQSSLPTRELGVDINGSGDITVMNNDLYSLRCNINGSGNINARNAITDHASVKISGSGDISVTVRKALDVHISGSGTVNYWGDSASVSTDISGSGKVHKN